MSAAVADKSAVLSTVDESAASSNEHPFTFRDWVPRAWSDNRSFVLVSIYRSFRVRYPDELPRMTSAIPAFDGIHVVLFRGEFSYLQTGKLEFTESATGELHATFGSVARRSAPSGSYVAILSPFDGSPHGEHGARHRIAVACAVARTELGFNAAHSLVHRFTLCPDGTERISGDVVKAPDSSAWADVTSANSCWSGLTQAIHSLPDNERRICELAFRWVNEAQESSGIDALLKTWIAIETISMRDSANIHPLNKLLATTYGSTPSRVNAELGTGLLFGLRSRIVHDGADFPVHFSIEDHAHALFRDIARARLDLNCGRFAEVTARDALPRMRAIMQSLSQKPAAEAVPQ